MEYSDIIEYYEKYSQYNDLCNEISYILRKRFKKDKIPVALITHRVKSFDSISRKMKIHKYQNIYNDIRDIAGVRLVYLYLDDKNKIRQAIREEFSVIETKDTTVGKTVNSFGYSDVKFYVKLGKQKGARYDDLKDLLCEIQVRTVMQDAWGIMSHHLDYKSEIGLPNELKRKLHKMAALLEAADDNFDSIRIEKEKYRKDINNKRLQNEQEYFKQHLNSDTIESYLNFRFKEEVNYNKEHLEKIILALKEAKYFTLLDIKDLLDRTNEALVKFYQDKYNKRLEDVDVVGAEILDWALYFDKPRPLIGWLAFKTPEKEDKYRKLIKPRKKS